MPDTFSNERGIYKWGLLEFKVHYLKSLMICMFQLGIEIQFFYKYKNYNLIKKNIFMYIEI